eukprot:8819274-Pyramimonas_sp.AAC.1
MPELLILANLGLDDVMRMGREPSNSTNYRGVRCVGNSGSAVKSSCTIGRCRVAPVLPPLATILTSSSSTFRASAAMSR